MQNHDPGWTFRDGQWHAKPKIRVLTGVTHTPGSGVSQFAANVVPVEQDPVLALRDYPPGYQTLKVGSLGPLFFYPATSSP